MTLAGVVWDKLSREERILLLRHCKTITHESIKEHESSLKWDELWPITQDDLLNVDFEIVLGRNAVP